MLGSFSRTRTRRYRRMRLRDAGRRKSLRVCRLDPIGTGGSEYLACSVERLTTHISFRIVIGGVLKQVKRGVGEEQFFTSRQDFAPTLPGRAVREGEQRELRGFALREQRWHPFLRRG